MKNLVLLFVFVLFMFSGCANDLEVNGKVYESYGLINQDDKKCPEIKYEPCWGNIILGCIFSETIIAPIYFFGFSMFEPVGIRNKK